jgi:hypothetical protein
MNDDLPTVTLVCAQCGEGLVVCYPSPRNSLEPDTIGVEPCQQCLDRARRDGYADGLDTSVSDEE